MVNAHKGRTTYCTTRPWYGAGAYRVSTEGKKERKKGKGGKRERGERRKGKKGKKRAKGTEKGEDRRRGGRKR